jgi:hypothetical protein
MHFVPYIEIAFLLTSSLYYLSMHFNWDSMILSHPSAHPLCNTCNFNCCKWQIQNVPGITSFL